MMMERLFKRMSCAVGRIKRETGCVWSQTQNEDVLGANRRGSNETAPMRQPTFCTVVLVYIHWCNESRMQYGIFHSPVLLVLSTV